MNSPRLPILLSGTLSKPAPLCLLGKQQTLRRCGSTELRHTGQVELERNHVSMQSRWKMWRHPEENETTGCRQTPRCRRRIPACIPPSLSTPERKTVEGSYLSTPGSSGTAVEEFDEGKRIWEERLKLGACGA
ncbi:hypothetical protein HPP92_012332 [Vanilla planifolia]|uniref:Uncharacterized protein n=1 Tax=Vanilla planifolia TaxID=51239 RepID=A0A835QQ96_VANPL|nr:hypothetical protein HPP92_012324 [Vanilla planifolia]KAG0477613.1 hypothetical protein HPP92_012332 [Vanilla planifolia]